MRIAIMSCEISTLKCARLFSSIHQVNVFEAVSYPSIYPNPPLPRNQISSPTASRNCGKSSEFIP